MQKLSTKLGTWSQRDTEARLQMQLSEQDDVCANLTTSQVVAACQSLLETCDFDSRRLHLTSCKAGMACPLLLTQPHAMNAIAVHIPAQWSGREARYTQRTLIDLWLMSGLTHGGWMMGNWAYRSQKCMRNQQQRVSRTHQWCCRTLTPHSPGLL